MSKPESETDPWAKVRTFDVSTYGDCRMERDYYGEIASEQKYQRGEYAWVDEVDAARAAEAAQHQQEIAAKDETIRQQAEDIAYFKDFRDSVAAALCVENEQGPVDPSAIVEAADSTLSQLFDFSARLAAVEAERDNLKGAMAADDARLRAAGERVDIQFGSDTADWMAEAILSLRAERDRLKAALQDVTIGMDRAGGDRDGMPECPWCQSQGRPEDAEEGYAHDVDCSLMMARAALTTQGQSTDGETR